MRLIDADAFDRDLCNYKFTAALNEAADAGTAFEDKEMYYSTQSFRDVMKYRPTVEAVPLDQLSLFLEYLFHGCPANAYPSCGHACNHLCDDKLAEQLCGADSKAMHAHRWKMFLSNWIADGMKIPGNMTMKLNDPTEDGEEKEYESD